MKDVKAPITIAVCLPVMYMAEASALTMHSLLDPPSIIYVEVQDKPDVVATDRHTPAYSFSIFETSSSIFIGVYSVNSAQTLMVLFLLFT